MSAPTSRPVHPCIVSTTDFSRGCEFSTWARLIPPGLASEQQLVTASANTIAVYSLKQGKLFCHYQFGNLSGNVVHLSTLEGYDSDALLVGFAGQAKLTIVTVEQGILRVQALLDLQPVWEESSYGGTSNEDVKVASSKLGPGKCVVSCVLGGGTAICCANILYSKKAQAWMVADDPYTLPLAALSKSLPHVDPPESLHQANLCTGFGQVLDVAFWPGYLEPVVVLLHSEVNGKVTMGRIAQKSDGDEDGGSASSLYCSALSVAVSHGRTALLWSVPVPSDAHRIDCGSQPSMTSGEVGSHMLVISVNSISVINVGGGIEQMIAVNGFARATCPGPIRQKPKANPIMRLALSLDECRLCWISTESALVSLQDGQLYVLQNVNGTWTLWPTGQTLGGIGQIEHMNSFVKHEHGGYLFCGSRLGDSLLFEYQLETTTMSWSGLHTPDGEKLMSQLLALPSLLSQKEEKSLQKEEDELYGEDFIDEQEGPSKKAKLATFTKISSLNTLDVLVNLGPLGKSMLAPIAPAPDFLQDHDPVVVAGLEKEPVWGAQALVQPCGFGNSGGVAIGTLPGRDDRMLRYEVDVLDVINNFAVRNFVFLGMASGGIKVMRNNARTFVEVDLSDWWVDSNSKKKGHLKQEDVSKSILLQASDALDGYVVLVLRSGEDDSFFYHVLVLQDCEGGVRVANSALIAEGLTITALSPPVCDPQSGKLVLSYLTSDGTCQLVAVTGAKSFATWDLPKQDNSEVDTMDIDGEDAERLEIDNYYTSTKTVAVDVFVAPVSTFSHTQRSAGETKGEGETDQDEGYDELYKNSTICEKNGSTSDAFSQGNVSLDDELALYVAVCRQSGELVVHQVKKSRILKTPVWQSRGCGHSVPILSSGATARTPRGHKVCTAELRFFSSGPTTDSGTGGTDFCLAIRSTSGDVSLYRRSPFSVDEFFMERVRCKSVTRPGQEQNRHRTKLLRKKMVAASSADSDSFRPNCLYRFKGISDWDGLFAATVRPFWVFSERGRPVLLPHRMRHAAPAGGKPLPITGFCCGSDLNPGYMTLHERVGRVGSQRLTLFSGLVRSLGATDVFPSSGASIERVNMGVTVREMHFLDDPSISTADRPLYILLVSKEAEADQGDLNDDGKTAEERDSGAREKEEARIKRQVEADLGGFDLENEWVEEIERDDCFKVATDLGGSPPIRKESYAVWVVDAAKGWVVLSSFELEENEHGLTINTMSLTDFPEEVTTSSDKTAIDEDSLPKRFFVVLGTGILDHNGEDVASKGRAVLLELKPMARAEQRGVELSVFCERPIYHGPVTTLVCLSSEGKNRLLIGAGADVNVEQLGGERLTQVGFFRATMQVADILQFKDFLLLSDAYDSLYFLIWRDSDKSLTLLAKDYDPIPVYAAGLMSRGPALTFICHDDLQNLQFFQYAPGEAAARGGNRLVCRADCRIGTQTIGFSSHFCRSSLFIHSATPTSTLAALKQQDSYFGRTEDDQRLAAYYGTSDGTMGSAVPVSESVFWRLTALQSILAHALEADCGLSPKSWRLYQRSFRRGGCRSHDRKNGVIDGDLVLQFADLSVADQEDVASAIGSTIGLILDNLLEIECASLMM